ncbi:MAG: hypothetical protein MUE45_06490 [Methanoregulaceae archaeon]|jgi:hypothetical protein|nr:hypothetical protein [Methanoregulaceae archaeon]MCU0629115.1 hypothetical protein [Methanoregulaceae archaeon]
MPGVSCHTIMVLSVFKMKKQDNQVRDLSLICGYIPAQGGRCAGAVAMRDGISYYS